MLMGQGDVSFVGAVGFPGGSASKQSVALGDVDGDERLDVLVGNRDGPSKLLLQLGDGSCVGEAGFHGVISGEDADQVGDSDGMGVMVSGPDLSAEAAPAWVLGYLAVCLLLLLRTERESRLSGGLRGCRPRGARGECSLRRAACRRLPRTAYHGLTRGVCRAALLLMLTSWLGGCNAAGTICSNEPTACDGTYSGTRMCAPLPRLPCATNAHASRP